LVTGRNRVRNKSVSPQGKREGPSIFELGSKKSDERQKWITNKQEKIKAGGKCASAERRGLSPQTRRGDQGLRIGGCFRRAIWSCGLVQKRGGRGKSKKRRETR